MVNEYITSLVHQGILHGGEPELTILTIAT